MKQPRIVIVDYGVGNTYSVGNAISSIGYRKIKVTNQKHEIEAADALILPGVGAFEACATNLKKQGLANILTTQVIDKGTPILGICVGMQLMADFSDENGHHQGLGWIEGHVRKINIPEKFSVPHVGWNNLLINNNSPIFSRVIKEETNFYFDHSYHYECDEKYIVASVDYGMKLTAAIQKQNIFGVQFHPEKSQIAGLKLFKGFLDSI